MVRDFFDPTREEQKVILVDTATLHKAEKLIDSCEHCDLEGAEIPFDTVLDCVTCCGNRVTDYILEEPAKCPNCKGKILEKTFVQPT